ncbi:MAG: hypothetical protein GY943_25180 [Chloroflexi bacterium]|nr:hypothetical protein [Chloroflexota bacterium]
MNQVKIKVRANQIVRFPGICVHCSQSATCSMPIKKRISRLSRLIDVPLCAACAKLLQRTSGEEERFAKIGKFVAIGVLLFVTAVSLLLTPAHLSFILRLISALFIGLLSGTAVYTLFHHLSNRATLPAKKAILNTAHITSFSWRTTTFAFTNETFTKRFKSINEPLLMHIV